MIAYKVLYAEEMASLTGTGVFAGSKADLTDGFIHLSTEAQVERTVRKHFAGAEGLWIAAVDLAPLAEAVRWEASTSGDLYPHLYAPLQRDMVLASAPLERSADGAIRLPLT